MEHVVKATVFMTDLKEFAAMNAVYEKAMPAPYPARSTIQVARGNPTRPGRVLTATTWSLGMGSYGYHARASRRSLRGASFPRMDAPTMSTFRKSLMKQGMKLMSDPRVMKLMQDERVMKAMMAAMAVPGKVQSFTKDQLETVAKAMALATEGEVKDLKRTVRKLEDEIAKMKDKDGAPKKTSSKS